MSSWNQRQGPFQGRRGSICCTKYEEAVISKKVYKEIGDFSDIHMYDCLVVQICDATNNLKEL